MVFGFVIVVVLVFVVVYGMGFVWCDGEGVVGELFVEGFVVE